MPKRTTLGDRRANEARGVDAIIKPLAPPEATGQLVEEVPQEELVEEPPPLAAAKSTERPLLAKVTLYIRPDQVEAIEEIQLAQRRKTGKKPDKSDLVQEALDLLADKYSSP